MQLEYDVDDDDNNNVAPDVIAPEPTVSTTTSSTNEGGENVTTTTQFYSVHCGYCQYEVAALDMTEEVYYFYACIASA